MGSLERSEPSSAGGYASLTCTESKWMNAGRPSRSRRFRARTLRVGDARNMPWADGTFALVIAWTVFSSILSDSIRQAVANEIVRVLRPGGALLYYDFAWNNPRNRNVRAVTRPQLRTLFAALPGSIRAVTLAPPLSRLIAPRSWLLATALDSLPFLRSHQVAVLTKPPGTRAPTHQV